MSGPKRNPDKLNTIGVVVVGICGAVLVYVSIVALQAFYMNDTSEIQTMADYGGNDKTAASIKTAQLHNITEPAKNAAQAGKAETYKISIDDAMRIVVEQAKVDPSTLVPSQGRADKATVQPIYGRPQPLAPATPPATTPAPADGAGAGSGSAAPAPADGAGSGSAAAAPPAAPMAPTGGQGQGGSAPTGGAGGTSAGGVPAPAVTLPQTTGTGSASKGNGK